MVLRLTFLRRLLGQMLNHYFQRILWLRQCFFWKVGWVAWQQRFFEIRFSTKLTTVSLYWVLILFVFIGFVPTATSLYLFSVRKENSFFCSFECDKLSEKNVFQNLFLYWNVFALDRGKTTFGWLVMARFCWNCILLQFHPAIRSQKLRLRKQTYWYFIFDIIVELITTLQCYLSSVK